MLPRSEKPSSFIGIMLLMVFCTAAFAWASAEGWHAVMEAEAMRLSGDWEVARDTEGYFPSAPNTWSGDRLRGGKSAEPATARQHFEVPADGRYALWVRYESPYGFDVHFDVKIRQGQGWFSQRRSVFSKRFGDRADVKYFNGAPRVQAPWRYHNTDYVYQHATAELEAGPAELILSKSSATPYTAARIIDLVYLTDDLGLEPGREMNSWYERGANTNRYYQPPIMMDCVRPVYFRLQVDPDTPSPARVTLAYRHRRDGWRGPQRDLTFTRGDGLTERYAANHQQLVAAVERDKDEFPPEELLPAGFDSGWVRYDMNTFNTVTITAKIIVHSDAPATLAVSHDPEGIAADRFQVRPGVPLELMVATGNSQMERELLGSRTAATPDWVALSFAERLRSTPVPGKRPFEFGNLITPREILGEGRWELFKAAGGSGVYFRVPPEAYLPENAERLGVNRSMAYRALQNIAIRKFEYYEGKREDLRTRLERVRQALEEDGVGDIPQTFKMIEESGPPPLPKLRESDILNERFRAYLKSLDLDPVELLDRERLAQVMETGETAPEDLWAHVRICAGTPEDAIRTPALFYHSKYFGSMLFADTCAAAVDLVEELFPEGTRANSGAFFPQDGHGVRTRWYDEFMLFRRRGMTSFGSEMSWGLNGTPYYVGTQSQSYEGAIARAVAKYHDATLGPTHLLACKRYGYPPEYVELAGYALASHGYRAVHYYINGEFTGFDHYLAMKRVGHALGAIEDRILDARVAPADVALGWSETTAIWDQAVPPDRGYNMPGNTMYALERHYLYILLRHLQLPVDLLSDADIAEGRLEDYRLFFQVGDHIRRDAAEALRDWVADGGVLVSGAGGGLWDEHNRPLDTLKEVYGIKGARHYAEELGEAYVPGATYAVDEQDNRLEKHATALRAKLELLHAQPLDRVTCNEQPFPVLGYRQGLTVEEGEPMGTFSSGRPAVVRHRFGEGTALIMGFLPGMAYLYQAYPMKPYGRGGEDLSVHLYPDYNPEIRAGFAELMRAVWPEMGAPVTASNPCVEANLMVDSQGRRFIAVVNYSGQPIEALDLVVDRASAGNPDTAEAEFADISTEPRGKSLRLRFPLDKFEFITLGPSPES